MDAGNRIAATEQRELDSARKIVDEIRELQMSPGVVIGVPYLDGEFPETRVVVPWETRKWGPTEYRLRVWDVERSRAHGEPVESCDEDNLYIDLLELSSIAMNGCGENVVRFVPPSADVADRIHAFELRLLEEAERVVDDVNAGRRGLNGVQRPRLIGSYPTTVLHSELEQPLGGVLYQQRVWDLDASRVHGRPVRSRQRFEADALRKLIVDATELREVWRRQERGRRELIADAAVLAVIAAEDDGSTVRTAIVMPAEPTWARPEAGGDPSFVVFLAGWLSESDPMPPVDARAVRRCRTMHDVKSVVAEWLPGGRPVPVEELPTPAREHVVRYIAHPEMLSHD